MQQKISVVHHNAVRKLFNAKLNKLGDKVGVILIDTEILNMYRDKKYIPTDAKTITAYLDLPRDELEIFGNNDHGTIGFDIYEVLNRYLWCSFEHNLSVDDYIMRQIYIDDERFILQMFQITKELVKGKTFLQQRRYLLAPVNNIEGVKGDNQLELALSSLVTDYRTEELPDEGTDIEVPVIEYPDPEPGEIDTTAAWYTPG